MSLRVVKVGGSLLDLVDLPVRVRAWQNEHPYPRTLYLLGGGAVVEAVRELDRAHAFPSTLVHWTCVDLMTVNARLMQSTMPWLELVDRPDELLRFVDVDGETSQRCAIVTTGAVYSQNESVESGEESCSLLGEFQLPEDWSTTSDTIAAALALKLDADELVLMKSTDCPLSSNITNKSNSNCKMESSNVELFEAWANERFVDEAFTSFARRIRKISVVNLRKWQP